MKFTFPGAAEDKQETAYQDAKRLVLALSGEVTDRRIGVLFYTEAGNIHPAKVGYPDPITGHVILAIFQSAKNLSRCWLVLQENPNETPRRKLVQSLDEEHIVHFDG